MNAAITLASCSQAEVDCQYIRQQLQSMVQKPVLHEEFLQKHLQMISDKHWRTLADFQAMLQAMHVNVAKERLERLMEYIDKDRDGVVTAKEFFKVVGVDDSFFEGPIEGDGPVVVDNPQLLLTAAPSMSFLLPATPFDTPSMKNGSTHLGNGTLTGTAATAVPLSPIPSMQSPSGAIAGLISKHEALECRVGALEVVVLPTADKEAHALALRKSSKAFVSPTAGAADDATQGMGKASPAKVAPMPGQAKALPPIADGCEHGAWHGRGQGPDAARAEAGAAV